jgi:hypothetical protein
VEAENIFVTVSTTDPAEPYRQVALQVFADSMVAAVLDREAENQKLLEIGHVTHGDGRTHAERVRPDRERAIVNYQNSPGDYAFSEAEIGRAELMALSPEERAEVIRLRAQNRAMMASLERSIASLENSGVRQEALWLAVGERLGRPAQDGDAITDRDEERAEQIMQFWNADLRG